MLGQIYERRHSISRARAVNGWREEGIKTKDIRKVLIDGQSLLFGCGNVPVIMHAKKIPMN